jgi:hypothetical protein
MPQILKLDDSEFDPKELDVEYDDTTFDTYDGEQPPSGTALLVNVKKLWWTYTSDDTPMLKVVMEAAGNEGEKEEYNGLPIWENLTFKASAAFKYGPFLEVTGIALTDIKKKMKVEDEDEKNGAPILSIGKFEPDSEDSLIGVITKRERYNGQWQVRAGKYQTVEEIEELLDNEPEEEDESKPRGRKTAASKPATKGTAKPARRAKAHTPEPEDVEDDEEEAEEEESKPRGSRTRTRATASKGKTAASKTPRRGSRRSKEDEEEAPF